MLDLERLLGPIFPHVHDPDVVEISLNPDRKIFVERFGARAKGVGMMDPDLAERFIRSCATATDMLIDPKEPIFSGRIPGTAHRIEAVLPPLVDGPMISIRRHRDQVLPLSEFAPNAELRQEIEKAIATRKNILVAGGIGSGKTTLTNSLLATLCEQAPDTRILVIEDTPELNVGLINQAQLRSSHDVSMDRLLVSVLRHAPNRIVVGEVRTGIVLMTLLKAWNTGHPGGITTIHANSAEEVLPRMQGLALEVSVTDQIALITSCLDLVLFVERGTGPARITQIARPVPGRDPSSPFSLETRHVERN
ncbi:ATPase, T2SS/T4P/T4SS family [uncultured Ruegeria sp.]|uniref:ATPase, T2SS/T4P/T4SS family n=1 Tax=uncultured Ruegeria sp. TaxID=259304 RepID=UPI002609111A|nr:ATPase, T2SS/T4P/T4SS family [uncultured Ruegeria sp.]